MSEPGFIGSSLRPSGTAPVRWPAHAGRATAEQLRALAFNGYAEHVRALVEELTPAERQTLAEPEVLRQAALGALARARALPPGAPVELRRERDFIESAVRLLVAECRRREVYPRDLFRTLLDWSDELLRASRLDEVRNTCDLAAALGVRAFPEIWPWIELRKAHVQIRLGHLQEAHAALAEACTRLDRVADHNAVPALFDALGAVSLQTRLAPQFKLLLVARLRVFHTNSDERRAVVDLLRRVHRGRLRLLVGRELSAADKLQWLLNWATLGVARRVGWRPLAHRLEQVAAAGAYLRQYGWRARPRRAAAGGRPAIEATLVTRAMGGLGDLLMMTPGLHALKASRPAWPVRLAIPGRFFPLFDGNDDVQLVDIDEEVDPAAYREWFNLTDCPAARIESRTAPEVRVNRIALFARGVGVRGSRLRTLERRPRYFVSAAERTWRDRFFADRGLRDAFIVGVQARTDEAYRDVPHMGEIVQALAQNATVLVFGEAPPPAVGHPRVIEVRGLTFRQAFALASGCDVIVAPDSAFFHLAGALDLPCVGLFGPTDGRVRGQDYPHARILDARPTLRCVPCWRNDAIPCGLTGLRPSACLGEIAPAAVVRAVREAADAAPRRRPVAG